MAEQFLEASPRAFARLTGFIYLLYFAAAAPLAKRTGMIVLNDPAVTANHILAGEHLYRVTLVTDLVSYALYLAVTTLLYCLLKPVNRPLALTAAVLSFAGCLIGAINTANAIVPLVLLHGGAGLAVFPTDQLQALSLVALRMFVQVYDVSLVFFTGFLLLAGYLVFASRFLPRLLGVLLVLAGLGWAVWVGALFLTIPLDPMLTKAITGIGILGEVILALWLLVVGVNPSIWRERAGLT